MKRTYAAAAILALAFCLYPFSTASAAVGDFVSEVTFSQDCASGIGVGLAFDGTDLWYSCYASTTDLLRADPKTGKVVASYQIAGGLGALAYDATRNAIWAGWGNGSENGTVRLITLDSSKTVTGSSVKFTASEAAFINLDDGLAYDATTDGLLISPDTSTNIYYYTTAGVYQTSKVWTGNACFNSGLAVGGELLYQGSDGCSHVWVVDKVTYAAQFDFSTIVAGDPNFRDEDLECDTNTFAPGTHVMWSKEAYSPMRAHSYVIPLNSCGVGGKPSVPTCSVASIVSGPPKVVTFAMQDNGSGLKTISLVSSTNSTVSIPKFTTGTTSPVKVTATKNDQGKSSTVSFKVTDVAGKSITCDPVDFTIEGDGRAEFHSFTAVSHSDHVIRIDNGKRGVTEVIFVVNDRSYVLRNLRSNQTRILDIASAMKPGKNNTIAEIAFGPRGSSASMLLGDDSLLPVTDKTAP